MSGISSLVVKIKTKTWEKDSYGLFDYETKTNITKSEFTIRNTGRVVRQSNQIHFIPLYEEIFEPGETMQNLALIHESDGELHLVDADDVKNEKLWMVVRHKMKEDKNGYRLQEGDVIKLGRVIFKIKHIRVGSDSDTNSEDGVPSKNFLTTIKQHCPEDRGKVNTSDDNSDGLNENDVSKSGNQALCRICLAEQFDDSDPLISPCSCKGSMKYIHLVCLQKWMRSKLNVGEESNSIITIIWKNLSCELCKEKLPLTHSFKNQELDILLFNSKSDRYIVMESLSKDCNPNGIHIIDFSKQDSISIGRGHECELRISDISVSRLHARLHYTKGKIYLEDKGSKFGTLVKMSGPVDLCKLKSIKVQCGRTTIKVNIKKSWNLFLTCFGGGGIDINKKPVTNNSSEKGDHNEGKN